MENPLYTPPPYNTSLSLCPSVATLFFLPSIYILLFLTALPGNLLSLWVFLRCISTISPTHIYLFHLSISNLFLSLTTPFLAAYFAWGSTWALRSIICQVVLHGITPIMHTTVYISILILTWVALSRFASLIKNTHASRQSTCTTLLPHSFFARLTQVSFANTVCATMWVVSVGGTVPLTVYYSVREAMASGEDGGGRKGGGGEVCYSLAVEVGGTTSATLIVPVITIFFVLYLLVLLSYVTVLRHIRRSRRNTHITTSQSLLARVFRNIVIILVVLSVCLLPYHIFKPIFSSLAHDPLHVLSSPDPDGCHPISIFVELKNFLFLLTTLRGSTDPMMYFLLDRAFRQQTLKLLRCNQKNFGKQQVFCSTTGSGNQKTVQPEAENVVTATQETSHGSSIHFLSNHICHHTISTSVHV